MANLWLQKELEDAETDRIAGDVVRTGAQFSPVQAPVGAQVDQVPVLGSPVGPLCASTLTTVTLCWGVFEWTGHPTGM